MFHKRGWKILSLWLIETIETKWNIFKVLSVQYKYEPAILKVEVMADHESSAYLVSHRDGTVGDKL